MLGEVDAIVKLGRVVGGVWVSVQEKVKEAAWACSVADCEGTFDLSPLDKDRPTGPLATMELLQETKDATNERKVKRNLNA